MKSNPATPCHPHGLRLLAVTIALSLGSCVAIATDLADVPLANSTTLAVPPNIALVIDDSGSTDDENMPDSGNTNKTKYCYGWYGYNTIAYNPAITYTPPIKADGTRFPDSVFSKAPEDGYFPVDGSTKMFDGSTTNTFTNLSRTSANIWMPNFRSGSTNIPQRATSVRVTLLNGTTIELLGTSPVPASYNSDEDVVGQAIADAINANSSVTGFTASYNATDRKPSTGEFAGTQFYGLITLTAPASQSGLNSRPSVTLARSSGTVIPVSAETFIAQPYYVIANNLSSTTCEADSNYSPVTIIAAPDTTPGSAAALTNYANWYSYYRKRAYLIKAGVGEAFAKLAEGKFRVGYFTIDSYESGTNSNGSSVNHDLKIDDFTGQASGTARAKWFDKVYGTRMAGYTPLRGALSRMGRMYAGKIADWDPVQYSCQRNYTLLTTDGFWNTNAEVTSGSAKYGPYKIDNTTSVGKQDGGTTTRPEYDKNNASDTLADVAYYYYHTDLRTTTLANCKVTRPDGSVGDVCSNDVPTSGSSTTEDDVAEWQHMTTFTLGLGVSGTLAFVDSQYKTATTGDYYKIKTNTSNNINTCGTSGNLACNWPTPTADTTTAVDDLWHAAVDGRGLYLSAKNPTDLATGLSTALNSMTAVTGSGAGAAAANLAPTTGTTEIYIAQYKTAEWYGDVFAYSFDADTGVVSGTASWQAGPLLDARIGTGGGSDSRTIYVSVDGVRKDFLWANLNAQQKAYFDNTKLSQYSTWTSAQKSAATGDALVNYLRGRYVNEDQTGQAVRLYRDRPHVLGDIIHSQPMYVKESANNFVTDKTYGGRMGMLYVAANDGMLHAFCTEDSGSCTKGKELWAYVVPPVMKNMWYLADTLQQGYHHYFVDGPIAVTDVYFNGGWKTILVGGLGKGGRAFYAMDITAPADPKLLWTFAAEGKDDKPNTADDNPNVGYSYGLPLATKVNGGDWRILLTSGYNNVPNDPKTGDYATADGGGHIFLLDPATGDPKDTISTGSGSPGAPSGLAQIQTLVDNFVADNSASKAFGGDLNGDMWRFDLAATPPTATKVISTNSPITTGPLISTVKGYSVLYFGTGRYLGQTDLDDTGPYYIVAVKADQSNLDLSATSKMVDQTDQTAKVDWSKSNGWYRLLGSGERVAIDPVLYQGTLLFATILPTGTECKPGGTSMLYEIDFSSGVGDGTFFSDPIVGLLIIDPPPKDPGPDPDPRVLVVDAAGKVKDGGTFTPPKAEGLNPGTRIMWRELVD